MNELTLKMKNYLIKSILESPRDLDEDYIYCGNKTYSRRDLMIEIENETEFGIELLSTTMTLALDMLVKTKIN